MMAATLFTIPAAHASGVDADVPAVDAVHPIPEASLDDVKALFKDLMAAANKHDVAAIRQMFWDSPSALIVAKSVDPAEGDWAGFWGIDAVTRKIHDIASSGPVTLIPDFSRLKAVGISTTVAETYAPMKIAVSYGGQNPAPRPFIMVINWLKTANGWKIASEIIIPVPPSPAKAG
jgi:ketosteroid isomerase-like protein